VLEHAPHARLLLYDYESVSAFRNYQLAAGHRFTARDVVPGLKDPEHQYSLMTVEEVSPFGGIASSPMLTTPMNVVQATGLDQNALYRYGVPFSVQLVLQYMNGFDLEFSREATRIAKGWSDTVGGPKYLLRIEVAPGVPSGAPAAYALDINLERYRLLHEDQ
jgi:hypothetical protein